MTARLGWTGIVVLLLAGCAREPELPPMYEIKGQVFCNGEPAFKARVIFHPQGSERLAPSHVARVEEDGTFVLPTGLPEGDYAITVVRLKKSEQGVEENVYPKRYEDPATSGLRITVKAETNSLPPIEINY
ncbi:MAG: hypothetical protein AB7K24_23755 [Gemmataceae bacterium]